MSITLRGKRRSVWLFCCVFEVKKQLSCSKLIFKLYITAKNSTKKFAENFVFGRLLNLYGVCRIEKEIRFVHETIFVFAIVFEKMGEIIFLTQVVSSACSPLKFLDTIFPSLMMEHYFPVPKDCFSAIKKVK